MKNKIFLGIVVFVIFSLVFTVVISKQIASEEHASPVVLDFNTYPGGNWQLVSSGGTSYVSGGILTINAPADYHQFILSHPNDEWHQNVSNSRGWVIETGLLVDSSTQDTGCAGRGPVQILAHDHTNLVVIGFSTDEICIAYPDIVSFPMNTTNGFHVYRIESQFKQVRVYVDDILRIDHTLNLSGGGSDILMFGDGTANTKSLSYWDYFWYDVFPSECGNNAIEGTEECDDGNLIDGDGCSSTCAIELCELGTYSATGTKPCDLCYVGYYQSQTGQTSCNACAPGSYSNVAGSSQCNLCAPGTYQSYYGGASCYLCAPGYSSGIGATSCYPVCIPEPEVCNGIDDNCDGSIDENNVCGVEATGIITEINNIVENLSPPPNGVNGLLVKLEHAMERISDAIDLYNNGFVNEAIDELEAARDGALQPFIDQVSAKISAGQIDPVIGNDLINRANQAIALINILINNYSGL